MDLGVCGGGALAHEVEVDGGGEGRGGEEDEPDVDAEFGLVNTLVTGWLWFLGFENAIGRGRNGEGKRTMPSLFAGMPFVRIA